MLSYFQGGSGLGQNFCMPVSVPVNSQSYGDNSMLQVEIVRYIYSMPGSVPVNSQSYGDNSMLQVEIVGYIDIYSQRKHI